MPQCDTLIGEYITGIIYESGFCQATIIYSFKITVIEI